MVLKNLVTDVKPCLFGFTLTPLVIAYVFGS